MAENSKIQWTHHTFNPWRGCTKVSAGCANCYAETGSKRNKRVLGTWGPNGTRVVASESMWREPLRWNQAAAKAGERHRVFCASFADVFEDWQGPMTCYKTGETLSINKRGHVWPIGWPSMSDGDDWGARDYTMNDVRARLFRLIDATPNLDWLLLTKRPENIAKMMPAYFPGGYIAEAGSMNQEGPRENVWIGTTVENQEAADERIPHLLNVPAKVRFLSVEPMLGPVSLHLFGTLPRDIAENYTLVHDRIHWVICGGESGHGARPFDIAWARDLRDQCKQAGVPFFMKQLGSHCHWDADGEDNEAGPIVMQCEHSESGQYITYDKKGGDIDEFPADLQVREFPQ